MIAAIYKALCDGIYSINNTLNLIANNSVLTKVWITFCAFLTGFFVPVQFCILFVFCMILLDMYYGIKASIKLKRKIESSISWNGTIRKMRDTFLLLCSIRGIEYFLIDAIVTTKVLTCGTALLISLTELWSVLENLNTIDPTGPWKLVSKFLRTKGEEYTGIDISGNDDLKK